MTITSRKYILQSFPLTLWVEEFHAVQADRSL